jgi:hypothetical protein
MKDIIITINVCLGLAVVSELAVKVFFFGFFA